MKGFGETFYDATEHALFKVTITSESNQRVTFYEIDTFEARRIYSDLQLEQELREAE